MRNLTRDTLNGLSPRALATAFAKIVGEDRRLAALVFAGTCLQLLVVGWDLPSAIGWENDGVAPRDFLRGVFNNLVPGQGHRYPLFHNLVLLILCLPVLLVVSAAGSLSRDAIVARVTSVTAMTGASIVIKLVHVAIGGSLVLMVARIARRLFGVNAGRGAALCLLTCLTVSYYTRTSNLDGPYMLWTALAIDRLLSVAERGSVRDYALLGLFTSASVATKDQAYASYVLTLPLTLLVLPRVLPTAFAAGSAHLARLRHTLGWSVLSYLLLAGVLVNPTGFLFRVQMLLGSNSQDWRSYARTPQGMLLNLSDLWRAQGTFFWHWGVVGLCWFGALLALSRPPATRPQWPWALRLLPLMAALSSVLFFTLPVARCEHRFVLPSAIWLSVYGGLALAWLRERGARGVLPSALAAASLMLSAWSCMQLALTQLGDARREVEASLAQLPRGSVVETYGFTVYQPRFDLSQAAPYRVQRVGKESTKKRAIWAGLREIQAPFAGVSERLPDALVINEGFAEQYLERTFRPGEEPSAQWLARRADLDGTQYFRAAISDRLPGYRIERVFAPRLPVWAVALGATPVSIHDRSTGERVWLLTRSSRWSVRR